MQRNENKNNRTKAEVSSAAEPATKKQKKDKKDKEVDDVEKKKENVAGMDATKEEDIGTNAALMTIMASLENIP